MHECRNAYTQAMRRMHKQTSVCFSNLQWILHGAQGNQLLLILQLLPLVYVMGAKGNVFIQSVQPFLQTPSQAAQINSWQKWELVSWCFEPSQPLWIISGPNKKKKESTSFHVHYAEGMYLCTWVFWNYGLCIIQDESLLSSLFSSLCAKKVAPFCIVMNCSQPFLSPHFSFPIFMLA